MTKIPKNSQLLIYPVFDSAVTAGYKDESYRAHYGYKHYGTDFVSLEHTYFNCISSGNGIVLGVEKNTNSAGGIIIVKYYNVYIPSTNTVQDLIVRYAHLLTINVSKGCTVCKNDVIGTLDNSHRYYNHIHVEVDKDIKNPFYTLGFKENSSNLLRACGATDNSMLDPINVFVIGNSQTAQVHPQATLVSQKDNPKYYEYQFEVVENQNNQSTNNANTSSTQNDDTQSGCNGQKLIFPINNMCIVAGYKNNNFKNTCGREHYGQDVTSKNGIKIVYASGKGVVLNCGYDKKYGYVVSIKYSNTYNEKTNKCSDICIRYFYLSNLRVYSGKSVTKDTVIGTIGHGSELCNDNYLHYEIDSDVRKQYAFWTPSINCNSNILHTGCDSTINPIEILHCKTSKPDNQSITRSDNGLSSDMDIGFKSIQ